MNAPFKENIIFGNNKTHTREKTKLEILKNFR